MDNGHRGIVINPTSDFQHDVGFFTPGVGNTPAENNDYKPEDNLDEENWQQALDISKPVDLPDPTKATGDSGMAEAKNPSEKPPIAPGVEPKHPAGIPELPNFKPPEDAGPKLGQIATIENSINLPEVKKSSSYNPDSIKTTGDKLETSSITEVDNAIAELSQTGNLSNFYEEIRNMTETNLDNSFNRKLYQNNTGGDK
ncbi:hypothetical protein IJG93_01065 [Candidatus Saccharibacteria bacterium]|nr:hypothetical protein [Candidatus Saccharibacteria bacterium]